MMMVMMMIAKDSACGREQHQSPWACAHKYLHFNFSLRRHYTKRQWDTETQIEFVPDTCVQHGWPQSDFMRAEHAALTYIHVQPWLIDTLWLSTDWLWVEHLRSTWLNTCSLISCRLSMLHVYIQHDLIHSDFLWSTYVSLIFAQYDWIHCNFM